MSNYKLIPLYETFDPTTKILIVGSSETNSNKYPGFYYLSKDDSFWKLIQDKLSIFNPLNKKARFPMDYWFSLYRLKTSGILW